MFEFHGNICGICSVPAQDSLAESRSCDWQVEPEEKSEDDQRQCRLC